MTEARSVRPVLALVESNTTGTGAMFAAAARRRGLRPVLLSAGPERYPWVAEDGVDVATADTADVGSVVAAARCAAGCAPLAGVVTSSEYFVAVTAAAAERLRLPGADPEAVQRCRDKRRQRDALDRAGLPVPAHAAAGSAGEAVEAATAIGYPVVVKPVDGSGSRGVRLCARPREVGNHAAALLAGHPDERGRPTLPAVLVEEYIAGPEYSVETFGTEVVGITAKHLGPAPWFVESGHDFPAEVSSGLDPGPVALEALHALGLGFGAAHTEIRLGPQGPVVIEVNPRLAGGRIPTLVRLATGIDLVGATVDTAVGAGRPLPRSGPGHASIRFLVTPEAGWLRRTGGVAAAAGVDGVVDVAITARAGQRVGGTGSFLDRVGYVIAAGSGPWLASRAAEAALACLELDVDTGDGLPGGAHRAAGRRPVPLGVAASEVA